MASHKKEPLWRQAGTGLVDLVKRWGPWSRPSEVVFLSTLRDPLPERKHPAQLGPYEVHGLLGLAGTAAYFAGRHQFGGGVEVTLKTPATLYVTPAHRADYEREARLMESLNHPGVVKMVGSGLEGDMPYLVFKAFRGWTLESTLHRQPGVDMGQKVERLVQVLETLDDLHVLGLRCHGFVEPSGILDEEGSGAKLMGCGMVAGQSARAIDDDGVAFFKRTQYWAPEILQGPNMDRRSDVFSVGCILYEMFVGRPPFEAETPTASRHRKEHEEADLSPFDEHPEIKPVLRRALAKAPDDRYETARAFAADLDRAFPRLN